MHLETTETHASLALALIPPGNVLREIAAIRGRLFTLNGLKGSRAWFDFPVLAWLSRYLDGGGLASLASTLTLPLEFGTLGWEDHFLTLPINQGFQGTLLPHLAAYLLPCQQAAGNEDDIKKTTKWCQGPFPAGKGLICAVLDESSPVSAAKPAERENLLSEARKLAGQAPRANIYSIAMVEMHWYPSPNYGSSWAILSSAIAGTLRGSNRSQATPKPAP